MGERRRTSKIEWQVIRLRARGEYLGTVAAPDDKTAVEVVLQTFALDSREERRLLVRQIKR